MASWLDSFLADLDPEDARVLRFADLEGRTQQDLARERCCQELCTGRLPDHAAATLMPSLN